MRVLGILLALMAFAALPASAGAKPGRGASDWQDRATIRFQGSNGYLIEVRADSGEGGPLSFAWVTAKNGPKSINYLVHGTLGSDDSLDVHLPHVGRIAVEFDPTKTTRRRLPAGCTGRPSIISKGYFRGTIELHGERDFTTVDRTSARGRVIRSFRKSCRRSGSRAERSASGDAKKKDAFTFLVAGAKQGSLKIMAMSNFLPGLGGTFVSAEQMQFREGMVIMRDVSVKAGPSALVAPDPGEPKVAELAPPAPFEGSATFKVTAPKTATWTGDLAVELPGRGTTNLAGRSFESTLCQGRHCTNTAAGEIGEAADLVASILG